MSFLEVVEIDILERDPLARVLRVGQQLFQPLHEGGTVEEAGERIVMSQVTDALVRPRLLPGSPIKGAARHAKGQRGRYREG